LNRNNNMVTLDLQSLIIRFREYLQNKGLSYTPQRRVIFEYLSKERSHFNTEELIASLREKRFKVSRATVYRTLGHLEDAGFLRQVALNSSQIHYEFIANTKHHEHVVCESCGSIIEFSDPQLEERIEAVAAKHNVSITRHNVQIFGICRRCREQVKT